KTQWKHGKCPVDINQLPGIDQACAQKASYRVSYTGDQGYSSDQGTGVRRLARQLSDYSRGWDDPRQLVRCQVEKQYQFIGPTAGGGGSQPTTPPQTKIY